MAPRLLGPHRVAACESCGNRFAVARELLTDGFPVRCFCCGATCAIEPNVRPGDLVKFTFRSKHDKLERFDVAVFRESKDSQPSVKRIWGMPGEMIELKQGELWLNGKLFQKNLQQLTAIAVPVSRFPDDPISHWNLTSGKETVSIESSSASVQSGPGEKRLATRLKLLAGQVICFSPRRPASLNLAERMQASEILDDYAIDQSPSLALHPVQDYFVAMRISQHQPTTVWRIHLHYHNAVYSLELGGKQTSNVQFQTNSRFIARIEIPDAAASLELLIAVCDGRALLAHSLEGKSSESEFSLGQAPSSPGAGVASAVPSGSSVRSDASSENHLLRLSPVTPIAIEVVSGELLIEQIVVARDLWLGSRHAREPNWSATSPLRLARYWVLGDNLAASVDSRETWQDGIPREWIEGTIERRREDWREVFVPTIAR